MMNCSGVGVNSDYGNKLGNVQKNEKQSSFAQFAKEMNSTFPDSTSTIEQKQQAIRAKQAILAHPGCPEQIKPKLMSEINEIQNEINNMQDNMNGENANVNQTNSANPYVGKQLNTLA